MIHIEWRQIKKWPLIQTGRCTLSRPEHLSERIQYKPELRAWTVVSNSGYLFYIGGLWHRFDWSVWPMLQTTCIRNCLCWWSTFHIHCMSQLTGWISEGRHIVTSVHILFLWLSDLVCMKNWMSLFYWFPTLSSVTTTLYYWHGELFWLTYCFW